MTCRSSANFVSAGQKLISVPLRLVQQAKWNWSTDLIKLGMIGVRELLQAIFLLSRVGGWRNGAKYFASAENGVGLSLAAA